MDNGVVEHVIDNSQLQKEQANQISEKMIPQSQVNEIVGSAKREAAERAVENYKRQQTQTSQSQVNYENNSYSNQSENDFRKIAGEEFKRHFNQIEQDFHEKANLEEAKRIVQRYSEKIDNGKYKYQDFESATHDNGEPVLRAYPNVVHLLSEHIDNAADVVYHLVKNRDKLYRIESLAGHRLSDAVYEMKRLSESIKSNDLASQIKSPNTPLSQQRPSNTGTDSGGSLSVRDYKKKYMG